MLHHVGEDNATKQDFTLESRLGISQNTSNLKEAGLEQRQSQKSLESNRGQGLCSDIYSKCLTIAGYRAISDFWCIFVAIDAHTYCLSATPVPVPV